MAAVSHGWVCVNVVIFFLIKIWTTYMDIMSEVIVTWQRDETKFTSQTSVKPGTKSV